MPSWSMRMRRTKGPDVDQLEKEGDMMLGFEVAFTWTRPNCPLFFDLQRKQFELIVRLTKPGHTLPPARRSGAWGRINP